MKNMIHVLDGKTLIHQELWRELYIKTGFVVPTAIVCELE